MNLLVILYWVVLVLAIIMFLAHFWIAYVPYVAALALFIIIGLRSFRASV